MQNDFNKNSQNKSKQKENEKSLLQNTKISSVQYIVITDDEAGQRIDNFLMAKLNNVPKSLIYRIVRKGEVRVNKKRIKPEYKLQADDQIRVPPIYQQEQEKITVSPKLKQIAVLEQAILYEDDYIIALNKPSGIAVHGGSGLLFGVIEGLRALRPDARFLELVHRIDRDTSGILLIAKKRSALRSLHEQLREKKIKKYYLALVQGDWSSSCKQVDAPLLKINLAGGDRMVKVDSSGKPSCTNFKVERRFGFATLIQASPITGRTHQIRVHTLFAKHPIAFDDRYGDRTFDEKLKNTSINRLFLHAKQIVFTHPNTQELMQIDAPLDKKLEQGLKDLQNIMLEQNQNRNH